MYPPEQVGVFTELFSFGQVQGHHPAMTRQRILNRRNGLKANRIPGARFCGQSITCYTSMVAWLASLIPLPLVAKELV